MLLQLLFALGLTAVTVAMHSFGSFEAMAYLGRAWLHWKGRLGSFRSAMLMLRVVSALLVLHWLEATVWALAFWATETLPDFETAFYFSLTTYTTIGFGDVVLPASWRLLAPFEGAVGILMFGWSTGIIVAVITRLYQIRLGLVNGKEEPPPQA